MMVMMLRVDEMIVGGGQNNECLSWCDDLIDVGECCSALAFCLVQAITTDRGYRIWLT